MALSDERIAAGQCPLCGKEAAPYRLCYDCRSLLRMNRCLKRGVNLGVFGQTGRGKDAMFVSLKASNSQVAEYHKWGSAWDLSNDGRSKPRIRGVRVDVERTLVAVMQAIGRPCSLDEINAAWGRLRAKRSAPLASDLAMIIAADDKRKRKMERRALAASPARPRGAASNV